MCGLISCLPPFQSDTFLTTSSPNKIFTVKLSGNRSAPNLPFIEHEVRFSLAKNGKTLVNNFLIDRYDWFDTDFGERYPGYNWVNEFTLRLGTDVSESEENPASLAVFNKTDKPVKYLRIVAGSMFFIFGMPPESKTKFVLPDLGGAPYISIEGEFADGQQIRPKGVNLWNKKGVKNSLRYRILVGSSGTEIESLDTDADDKNKNP